MNPNSKALGKNNEHFVELEEAGSSAKSLWDYHYTVSDTYPFTYS